MSVTQNVLVYTVSLNETDSATGGNVDTASRFAAPVDPRSTTS
jgi:hypothetical protein